MGHKGIRYIIAMAAISVLVSSCALPDIFFRQHGFGDGAYSVETERNVNNLEDQGYYVRKNDGTYQKLYIGDTNFRGNADATRRVVWFGKDYDKVPVMQKGESLVYRSATEFTPRFSVERFQDLGYTLGICTMTPTSAGRYRFSTNPRARCIDINSSAGDLYNLGEHYVTMEMIGDTQLRMGNISLAGTIVGLERGKTYSADIYIGTEVLSYNIVADVRAMLSMENDTITEFTYEKGKVISFSFPDYYNSGYYYVNGYGMVKYVNSDREFDETIAMNVPNPSGADTVDDAYQPSIATTETVPFRIDEQESVRIEVNFEKEADMTLETGTLSAGYSIVPPSARVIGDNGTYALNLNDTQDALVGVYTLEPGDYRIEISGLAGRTYSYMVRKESEN